MSARAPRLRTSHEEAAVTTAAQEALGFGIHTFKDQGSRQVADRICVISIQQTSRFRRPKPLLLLGMPTLEVSKLPGLQTSRANDTKPEQRCNGAPVASPSASSAGNQPDLPHAAVEQPWHQRARVARSARASCTTQPQQLGTPYVVTCCGMADNLTPGVLGATKLPSGLASSLLRSSRSGRSVGQWPPSANTRGPRATERRASTVDVSSRLKSNDARRQVCGLGKLKEQPASEQRGLGRGS